MSIFNDLASQVEQLLGSPSVQVEFHTVSLASESQLGDLEEVVTSVLKIRCPPAVLSSVALGDQLNVYWNAKSRADADAVIGEFFLRSVLLFGRESGLSPTFLSEEISGVDLRNTRVFDYCAYNGGPIYALLPVVDNAIEDRVLIFNEKSVLKTSLDYMGYLQALRRTRGILFWQYLFCDTPRFEASEVAAIETGLKFLKQTFPDEDYSDLNQRLRRLKGVAANAPCGRG